MGPLLPDTNKHNPRKRTFFFFSQRGQTESTDMILGGCIFQVQNTSSNFPFWSQIHTAGIHSVCCKDGPDVH